MYLRSSLCFSGVCDTDDYHCGSGFCVTFEAKCNGFVDCFNQADEKRCGINLNYLIIRNISYNRWFNKNNFCVKIDFVIRVRRIFHIFSLFSFRFFINSGLHRQKFVLWTPTLHDFNIDENFTSHTHFWSICQGFCLSCFVCLFVCFVFVFVVKKVAFVIRRWKYEKKNCSSNTKSTFAPKCISLNHSLGFFTNKWLVKV